jgi:hypothetical protein
LTARGVENFESIGSLAGDIEHVIAWQQSDINVVAVQARGDVGALRSANVARKIIDDFLRDILLRCL